MSYNVRPFQDSTCTGRMSRSDSNSTASKNASSGAEVYELIIDLCKDEIQIMLENMIETAKSFAEWTLSDTDSTHLAQQLFDKKRIIKSSFAFQLEKGFSDFKSIRKTRLHENDSTDWKALGLVGANSATEVEELETIIGDFSQLYGDFYQTLIQRLQFCLNRTRVEIDENPMHVKRLCESFQNSIDSLNLETKYNLALYRLFASTTLVNLGPIYRKMERCLLDHNILPQLKPARFSLRSCTNLSESMPPKSMPVSDDLKLILLLQKFKEKSRDTTMKYQNLFPELKEELLKQEYSDFDQPLEQLGLQFKIIFNDEDLPSNIKAQLARLQVYFFISAIRENGFLNRSSHPARRLLDTVVMSEVEFATTDKAQFSGHDVLKDGIDKITGYQTVNSESYQELLTQYKSQLETANKENDKNRQEAEPEDPAKTYRIVESVLEGIVEPLRAQKKSLHIFEEVWSPLMLEVALTQGFKSPAWQKVVAIVKTHVWALIPKTTKKEQTKLLAALPQIARSLKGVMKNLKFTAREQKLLLENLTSEHDDVLEKTDFNIGQATQQQSHKKVTAKKRILESLQVSANIEEPDQKELINDIDDFFSMMETDQNRKTSSKPSPEGSSSTTKVNKKSTSSEAEKMQVGDWIECKKENKTIMAKLTWKADDFSLFIFIDQNGQRVSEIDGATLNKELKSGEKSLIKAQSPGSKRNQSSVLHTLGS